jgi:hypothetical protein
MAAMDGTATRLRELHEDYAWEINAAVGRGEDRVVARLVDRFEDEALRLMTEPAREAS